MAITITLKRNGSLLKTWDITATLDADVNAFFAHGFVDVNGNKLIPEVWASMISTKVTLVTPWAVIADQDNVYAVKPTNVGSSDADPQVRIFAWIPHTMVAGGSPSDPPS